MARRRNATGGSSAAMAVVGEADGGESMKFETGATTTADPRTDLPNRSTGTVRFESEVDHRNESAVAIDHGNQIHTPKCI